MGNEKETHVIIQKIEVSGLYPKYFTPNFKKYLRTMDEIEDLEKRTKTISQERAGHSARLGKKSINPEEVKKIGERLCVIAARLKQMAKNLTDKEERLKSLEKTPEVKGFDEWAKTRSSKGIDVGM